MMSVLVISTVATEAVGVDSEIGIRAIVFELQVHEEVTPRPAQVVLEHQPRGTRQISPAAVVARVGADAEAYPNLVGEAVLGSAEHTNLRAVQIAPEHAGAGRHRATAGS